MTTKKTEISIGPHNMYWRGSEYWGGRSIDTYYFEKGTLILDFIEADSKELICSSSIDLKNQIDTFRLGIAFDELQIYIPG